MSYPLYIIQLATDLVICRSETDINHSDFWETTVSKIVAEFYKIPQRLLLNLPYCQRRARVVGQRIYYGEGKDKALLRLIRKTLEEKTLFFVHDDHECRLEYDVSQFNGLLNRYCPKSIIT